MSQINYGTWSAAGLPGITRHFTYGNYGGAGWTGGQYYGDAFGGPAPVNQLDAMYQLHDQNFIHGNASASYSANRAFLDAFGAMVNNPASEWNNGEFDSGDKNYGRMSFEIFRRDIERYERDNDVPDGDRWVNPIPPPEYNDGYPAPIIPRGYGWMPGDPLSPPPTDPLVLDLDGDGIELLSVEDSEAYFDFDNDGFLEKAGWVASDDGLLAIDLDQNGQIDDLSELFGSDTVDGFSILTPYDTNGDGVVSAADARFGDLRVWRDLDGDGVSDAGELQTLADAGVQSIALAKTASNEVVEGNRIAFTGAFTRTDGTTDTIAAVFFGTNQTLSRWVPPTGFVVAEETWVMPTLAGYGTLKNLDAAMTLDTSLRQVVQSLIDTGGTLSGAQLRTAFEQMLYKWANVETVSPTGRGVYVDGQHLAFVEAFYGSQFEERIQAGGTVSHDPGNVQNGVRIEKAYHALIEGLMVRFFAQVPESQAAAHGDEAYLWESVFVGLNVLTYDRELDRFSGNFFDAFEMLAYSAPDDPRARMTYLDTVLAPFSGTARDYFGEDRQAFLAALGQATVASIDDAAVREFILARVDREPTSGTAAGETVAGTAGADILWGGAGSDTLSGAAHDDIYVYVRGDGDDSIVDSSIGGGSDTLLLVGLAPGDVSLERGPENQMVLVVAASTPGGTDGGRIAITGQFDYYYDRGVERVVFADGTVWRDAELRAGLIAAASTSGDDLVVGFDRADTLQAGLGDDVVRGGGGDDTYIYNRGDGEDSLEEMSPFGGTADRLVLVGITPAQVTLERAAGNAVVLVVMPTEPGGLDGGRITVAGQFDDYYHHGIEEIGFPDGTVWGQAEIRAQLLLSSSTPGNDVIDGFDTSDTLQGGLGDDLVRGFGGDDLYVYSRGDGVDTLHEGGLFNGSADRLALNGVTPGQVKLERAPDNALVLVIEPTSSGGPDGGRITLPGQFDYYYQHGIEDIAFSDGTVWGHAEMRAQLLLSSSTPGNDLIDGFDTPDTLRGGLGNDVLRGFAGDDTYVYDRGDGVDIVTELSIWGGSADALVFGAGIAPSQVTWEYAGDDAALVVAPSTPGGADGGRIELPGQMLGYYQHGVEQIRFADGTIWM